MWDVYWTIVFAVSFRTFLWNSYLCPKYLSFRSHVQRRMNIFCKMTVRSKVTHGIYHRDRFIIIYFLIFHQVFYFYVQSCNVPIFKKKVDTSVSFLFDEFSRLSDSFVRKNESFSGVPARNDVILQIRYK